VKHVTKEINVGAKAQYGRRVEKSARNWLNMSRKLVSSIGSRKKDDLRYKENVKDFLFLKKIMTLYDGTGC
jgi:hypothetical protein